MTTERREGRGPSVAWCLAGGVRSFYVPLVHESILRNAIRAVGGDASRVVPWLDTGRFPHDGDPMSAGDLSKLITAAHKAGLRRMNCECRLSCPGCFALICSLTR